MRNVDFGPGPKGRSANSTLPSCTRPSLSSVLVLLCRGLPRIVSRVDVGNAPGPVAMELDDRRSLGEGVVARALGDGVETTRLHLLGGRLVEGIARSEERRVGKECRSRWSPYH